MWVRSPPGPLFRSWACRLTGRRSACTRQMRVQLPPRSTAPARWWNGRHAVLRRPCPPWREGSSPSLVTVGCAMVRLRHGVMKVVSRLGALALRKPVGGFDSCTTYCWPGPRQGIEALNLGRAGSTPALAAVPGRRCSAVRRRFKSGLRNCKVWKCCGRTPPW